MVAAANASARATDVGVAVRVPKMAELVARSLRRQIVQGDLSEGEPLPPESELMRQFGVSRPTLREAFRVLESENLIIIRRGARGGARVLAPSADVAAQYAALLLQFRGATLVDVYRAREVIEPPMIRLLAEKRTQAQLKELRARLDDEARVGSEEPHLVDAKSSIHRMLIEMAGNQTIAVLAAMLDEIIEQAVVKKVAQVSSTVSERMFRRGYEVHEAVLDLIEARDGDAAEKLWREHLVDTEAYMTRGMGAKKVLDLFD